MPPKKDKKGNTIDLALVEPQVKKGVKKETGQVPKEKGKIKIVDNVNEKSEVKPTKPKSKKQEKINENVQNVNEQLNPGKKPKNQTQTLIKDVKPKNEEKNIAEVDVESKNVLTRSKTQQLAINGKKTEGKNKELINDLGEIKPEKKRKLPFQQLSEDLSENVILTEENKPKKTQRKPKAQKLCEDENEDVKPIQKPKVKKVNSKSIEVIVESKQNEDVIKTRGKITELEKDVKPTKKKKKPKTQKLAEDCQSEDVEPVKNQNVKKPKTQNLAKGSQSEDVEPVKNRNVKKPKTQKLAEDCQSEDVEPVKNQNVKKPKTQNLAKGSHSDDVEPVKNQNEKKPKTQNLAKGSQSEDVEPVKNQNVKKPKTKKLVEDCQSEDVEPVKSENVKKPKTQNLAKGSHSGDVEPVKKKKVKKPEVKTKDDNENLISHDEEIKLNDQEEDNPSEDSKSVIKSTGRKTKITKEVLVEIENKKVIKPTKKTMLNQKAFKKKDLMKINETEEKMKQDDNLSALKVETNNLEQTFVINNNLNEKIIIVHEPTNYTRKSRLTTIFERAFDLEVPNDKNKLKPITSKRIKEKEEKNEECIKIENFSISSKDPCKDLFLSTNLYITYGRRYGLVGPNGCGKTTLLSYLASRMFLLPPKLSIMMYCGKEVKSEDTSALDSVLKADKKLNVLFNELEKLNSEKNESTAIENRKKEVHEELKKIDIFAARSKAIMILEGLGLNKGIITIPTKNLSHKLKIRVSLAISLFIQPTLLLLDEPTNYLDSDAVIWLGNYLQRWEKTLIIASHEESLLDNVCNEIIHIDQHKLHYYKGNYTMFTNLKKL